MAQHIRVVKVPVDIVAKSNGLKYVWFYFLNEWMKECQRLCNHGILHGVCFKKLGLGPSPIHPNKTRSLSGAIYDAVKSMRYYVSADILASVVNFYVIKVLNRFYSGVARGENGLPAFRNPMFVFKPGSTIIQPNGLQYIITLSGFQLVKSGVSQQMVVNLVNEKVKDKGRQLKAMQKNGKSTEKQTKAVQNSLDDWKAVQDMITSGVDILQSLGKSLVLETRVSKKDKYMQQILNNLLSCQQGAANGYRLGISRLMLRDGELMVYLSFESVLVPQTAILDPNKVMGIDLGVSHPVVFAIRGSKERGYLGDKDEILGMRNKFRALNRRNQRTSGLFNKSNKWEQSDREINWFDTYYRTQVARLIQHAVKNGIGTIHAEDLSGLWKKMSKFSRLIMNPFKLRLFLEQACQKAGICLVFGNPKYSSHRCHRCGYTSLKNRNPKTPHDFKCISCGYTCDADYNAAVNIANWTPYEIEHGIGLDDDEKWEEDELAESPQAIRIAV